MRRYLFQITACKLTARPANILSAAAPDCRGKTAAVELFGKANDLTFKIGRAHV